MTVSKPAGVQANDLLVAHVMVTGNVTSTVAGSGWTAVASWDGVRLSEIARLAGVDERARFVEFRSFDSGYWSSWDLESALHPFD